jgi:hypothetical protein
MHQWSWVADKVLQKHADVIDVVCLASRSCNCFTKVRLELCGVVVRSVGSKVSRCIQLIFYWLSLARATRKLWVL